MQNVSTVIVTTYSKLTVAQDFELRKVLRSSGAKYTVVKNTLAELAAKGTKVEGALKDLSGVTSIAYTEGDPVALAKALSKYAKDNPEFTFKAGCGRRPCDLDQADRGIGVHAVEGRNLLQAAVPAQFAGAAAGHGDERRGPRSGSCNQPGSGEEQVWRRSAGERVKIFLLF